MTENKPIMIDRIDVSGCEFLTKTGHCKAHMSIMGTDTNKCECFSNCYYKQLKRKEQECFELQMTANAYNPLVKLANYRLDKIEDLQEQLDQLKASNEQAEQKLEKIAEIANGMHDMWINKTQYTDVYNLAEHLLKCELNRIINEFDEIDEVE